MLKTKFIIKELNTLYKQIYSEIMRFSKTFLLRKLPDSYITNQQLSDAIAHTKSYGEIIRESNPACIYEHYCDAVRIIEKIVSKLQSNKKIPKFDTDKYFDLWDSNIGFPMAIREFYEAMYYIMKGQKLFKINVRGIDLMYLGESKQDAKKNSLFELNNNK